MSSFAVAWAWDQDLPEKNEKLLLLLLADNADRNGEGQDLESLIADAVEVCGMGRQTVQTHLESLEQAGLVERADGAYRLLLGDRRPKRRAFRLEL